MYMKRSLVMILLGLVAISFAWVPKGFQEPGKYVFEVSVRKDSEMRTSLTTVDVTNLGEGKSKIFVSFETVVPTSDLADFGQAWGSIVELWGIGAFFGIPYFGMIMPIYEQLEFYEGEKMSLYNMGYIEVGKKKKVCGRTGYETYYYDNTKKKGFMMTIDPDFPVPLEVVVYDESGNVSYTMVLKEYKPHK